MQLAMHIAHYSWSSQLCSLLHIIFLFSLFVVMIGQTFLMYLFHIPVSETSLACQVEVLVAWELKESY